MDLQKEVEYLLNSGKTSNEIIDTLTSRDYSVKDVKTAMSIARTQSMDKKVSKVKHSTIIFVIIGIIAVVLLILKPYLSSLPPEDVADVGDIIVVYSEDPIEWLIEDNGTIEINVDEATEGEGISLFDSLQIYPGSGEIYSLKFFGQSFGEYFSTEYYNEDFELEILIGPELKVGDEILNAYATVRYRQDNSELYLFVDEDWKQAANGEMNIIWGNVTANLSTMHTKKFDFSNGKDGIYVDKLDYDVDWYTKGVSEGGVFFGEIDFENYANQNYDGRFVIIR